MSPVSVTLLALCLVEGVVSIYLNLGIVYIYVRGWMRGQKLNTVGLIHLIMGTNNLAMRGSRIVDDLVVWLPELFTFDSVTIFFLQFHLYYNYWLTAWLSAYYCLTISSFSQRLVLSIKRNVPYFLSMTGAGSLAIAFLQLLENERDLLLQNPTNETKWSSFTIDHANMTSLYKVLATGLGAGLPFIGIAFFLMVTVLVLLKHVHNIGHTGSNIQVHLTAIKTMVMFLIGSTFFLICNMLVFLKESSPEDLDSLISWYISAAYPTVEAIIIIHVSPKLRKMFPRWLYKKDGAEN